MKKRMDGRYELFIKERNEALLSLDKQKILAYSQKYSGGSDPESDIVFWAGVHKARVAIAAFPESEKAISRQWLKEHGFHEEIRGKI